MGLRHEVLLVARGWRWTRRSLTPRSAQPWTPPRKPREVPLEWARTRGARVVREVIQGAGLKPLVWSQTRPRVEGLDRLQGLASPVVFVSNHASHLDAPLILCSLPPSWRDRTAVGAAADYFFDARWRALSTALVFNTFPVDRFGGRRATDEAIRLLGEGWSVLLFPEGTRSADGWVQRFRHGSAHLCRAAGVPAVPIAVRGSYASMPRGRSWPRPGRMPVSVRFGPPVWPGPGESHRALSERLADAVARLWDEDQADWYASLRRAADGRTARPGGPDAADWRRKWEALRPLPQDGAPPVWRPRA